MSIDWLIVTDRLAAWPNAMPLTFASKPLFWDSLQVADSLLCILFLSLLPSPNLFWAEVHDAKWVLISEPYYSQSVLHLAARPWLTHCITLRCRIQIFLKPFPPRSACLSSEFYATEWSILGSHSIDSSVLCSGILAHPNFQHVDLLTSSLKNSSLVRSSFL